MTQIGLSRVLALGLVVGLLAGCSQADQALKNVFGFGSNAELAAAEKMPPAEMPVYAPEDTYVYRVGDNLIEEKVVSVSPDRVVWTNDRGLIWTVGRDIVTPPLSWSANAELGRGRQAVIGSPAQLFPLQTGNTVSFGIRGSSENLPKGWQDTQVCEVGPQELITVAAGSFRTYKIICQREDHIDIIYYAPEIQNYALRVRRHEAEEQRKELVAVRLNEMPATAAPKGQQVEMKAARKPTDLTASKLPPTGPEQPASTDAVKKPAASQPAVSEMEVLAKRVAGLAARIDKIEKHVAGKAAEAAAKPAPSAADPKGKYGVHLASYRSERGAKRGWKVLQAKYKAELEDKQLVVRSFNSGGGKGTYQRLIAGYFGSRKLAAEFCRKMKLKRQYCLPVRARP